MDKILAYKNDQVIEEVKTRLKWTAENLQIYIDKYNAFPDLPELETADLESLFFNPRTFFVQKLTEGEVLKIGKLTLSSEKVYDMMDRPDGLDKFVAEIDNLNNYTVNKDWVQIYLANIKNMDLVNNVIVPKQSYINEQTELHSYYVETDNQHAALAVIAEITPKLNNLFALLQNDNNSVDTLLLGTGKGNDRTFQPNLSNVRLLF